MFKSIKLKIMEKGKIVEKRLVRVLQDHEDRLATIEQSESQDASLADVTSLATQIDAITDAIGADNEEGTILARLKVLDDYNIDTRVQALEALEIHERLEALDNLNIQARLEALENNE